MIFSLNLISETVLEKPIISPAEWNLASVAEVLYSNLNLSEFVIATPMLFVDGLKKPWDNVSSNLKVGAPAEPAGSSMKPVFADALAPMCIEPVKCDFPNTSSV